MSFRNALDRWRDHRVLIRRQKDAHQDQAGAVSAAFQRVGQAAGKLLNRDVKPPILLDLDRRVIQVPTRDALQTMVIESDHPVHRAGGRANDPGDGLAAVVARCKIDRILAPRCPLSALPFKAIEVRCA